MQAHHPIKQELNEVEMAIKSIGKNTTVNSTLEVFNYFFRMPGKYLRPSLTLLSANAINQCLSLSQRQQIIDLSVAVELIHSASLIHDDIIDGDLFRRGQKALNKAYGKKIAVLAGDTLFAQAFSILSNSLPRESEQIITQVIEEMCLAEIDQAQEGEPSQQRYLKIIEGKTASFMSACCTLGASLAGAEDYEIKALASYGLNFGMVYQIMDDYMDNKNICHNVNNAYVQQFTEMAVRSTDFLKPSVYKQGLVDLLDDILRYNKVSCN